MMESVSMQLAHETARTLEARGEIVQASELLAIAYATEARRVKRTVLSAEADDCHEDDWHGLTDVMERQQQLLQQTETPDASSFIDALNTGDCAAQGRWLTRCLANDGGPARPFQALHALAIRWHLPPEVVASWWREFRMATGGAITLSAARARAIASSAPEGGSASHAWSFAVARLTREQRAEGEGGATSDAPTAPDCCLDFEDYLVIRGFTEAACLEDQFRFLWRLLDDDRDGVFSRDDLLHALQLAAALLGWDERTIGRWMKWTVRALGMPESDSSSAKPIGAPEVRSALGKSAQLRAILLARDPAALSSAACVQ